MKNTGLWANFPLKSTGIRKEVKMIGDNGFLAKVAPCLYHISRYEKPNTDRILQRM